MPATEKTWRDQLRMHAIFGVSSLVMLFATVWMLWKDHNREWRKWQLADRSRVQWTIEAQLAQAEADSQGRLNQLNNQLFEARRVKVDPASVEEFRELAKAEDERPPDVGAAHSPADYARLEEAMSAMQAAAEGSDEVARARAELLDAMGSFIHEAKRREDVLTGTRRFRMADLTKAKSDRGIAIRDGRPTAEIEDRIEELENVITNLDVALAATNDYRTALEGIVARINATENDLLKETTSIDSELARLRANLKAVTTNPGEWIVRGPILDAFYTGDIKLDQIWLPDLKINYNFSEVARYDRCINCHRAIDKTAPGSAVEPAYPAIPRNERKRLVELATPAAPPEGIEGDEPTEELIEAIYGFRLAQQGQVNRDDVTIQVVFDDSLAAKAGLEMGDVIVEINGGPVRSAGDVRHYLWELADWGRPLAVEIRRGLDQPFTSHPRLDLYLGSLSPHKRGDMGCTICHDGQGSATEFKWASHTPNDPHQAVDWSRDYGWFDNHHWTFPMTPQRFIESNCLKCHHEVVELEPSERFPDPPAPKLVEGYHLISEFGCYGCHEINGYDGPDKRIGPDLRLEPNYFDIAQQILQDGGLNESERNWARALVDRPDDNAARDQLMRSVKQDASLTAAGLAGAADGPARVPRLTQETHDLADALKDVEAPGRFRKVGPSLRHLAAKVDFDWLYRWIRRPADFRPTTRMPQFFGQHEHLEKERPEFVLHDADGNAVKVTDREYTERFEKIEIRALADFLLEISQPFEYLEPAASVNEAPSAELGRWLFETRGCLACHSHREFPGIASTQGPDLSRLAAKFNSDDGKRWLYSWLKGPHRYHARTVMPDLFLDPIAQTDATGAPTGLVTDPAADIVEFLLSVPADWQPEVAPPSRELTAEEQQDLTDLTAVWLTPSFQSTRLAERYAREGIPESNASQLKADELVLVGMTPENRVERQLQYVARRSLSRYGCFGCHDIPGYETAKPIGTPLADWGRKDTSQLAFENIARFLERPEAGLGAEGGGHGLDPSDYDDDVGYFLQALFSHQRNGFIWQKLRMPRSFDYEATKTKRYDERLRMPLFPFDDAQREAVMTFILGLTNEAPDTRYIYRPDRRQEAIVQGRHVLDKYNCAGCHVLDMERWDIAFEPGWFGEPMTTNDFPFLAPVVTEEQVADSLDPDHRGLLHAQLHGMPTRDEQTGEPQIVDEDEQPLFEDDDEFAPHFLFTLYEPAVVDGEIRRVGLPPLLIPAKGDRSGPANGTRYPGWGGDLAKYLYPRVIDEKKRSNPALVPTEAWSWLPPPLHDEGVKVQTEWLHDFLMDPTSLRPAVVLRMPNFRMSSDEATKLVNYFAAKSDAEFPYEYNQRRRNNYLAQKEAAHPGGSLLDDAMKIVTDVSFCVQCHSIGDYEVRPAPDKTFGPRLDDVYRRLRPEYVHRWVANPVRILPYTGMPVNIPYEPPVATLQQLFPGTSTEQLDGVVELLMNYDEYAKRRTSVKSLVREPTVQTTTGAGGE